MTATLRLCERPKVTLVRGRELFDSFFRHKPKCQLTPSHLYSCFEVRLYLHASTASDGAIVHHLGDSWMTVEHQWNENWHSRRDTCHSVSVHHKTQMDSPESKTGSLARSRQLTAWAMEMSHVCTQRILLSTYRKIVYFMYSLLHVSANHEPFRLIQRMWQHVGLYVSGRLYTSMSLCSYTAILKYYC